MNTVTNISNTKLIVSGSGDNTIKIWNFEKRECRNTLYGHSGSVISVRIIS